MAAWARAVRGLLLDISGVLYDSGGEGGGVPIAGSAEAVRRYVRPCQPDPALCGVGAGEAAGCCRPVGRGEVNAGGAGGAACPLHSAERCDVGHAKGLRAAGQVAASFS